VTDLWSERAQAYRESEAHREGRDLELVVEWAGAAPRDVLDVATGGGHVARVLREVGHTVVTTDSAPGMQPDVVTRAEDLPFADESFDVVVCRVAAHHFENVAAALQEMARVTRNLVVVADNAYLGVRVEEAERLRDPTHVRCYSEDEWREFVTDAGFEVEQVERFARRQPVEPWFERVDTPPADAQRIRELLADRIEDGMLDFESIVLKARRSQK
jgi:SAM-dependent methyltransferase